MQEVNLIGRKRSLTNNTTFDPTKKGPNVRLSNNNKRVTTNSGDAVLGTSGKSDGKWYYEVKLIRDENGTMPLVGVATYSTSLTWPWRDGIQEILLFCSIAGVVPQILYDGPRFSYGSVVAVSSAIIGVALDFTGNTLEFFINNVPCGKLIFRNYTNGTTFYPMVSSGAGGSGDTIAEGYFGTDLFYPIPTGFQAW